MTRKETDLAQDAAPAQGPQNRGDLDRLIPAVYDHLRALAGKLMQGQRPGSTLQPTGLVHEVYLRLLEQRLLNWQDRGHFFHIAARVMRRVLVDHCRSRASKKRGGGEVRITLVGSLASEAAPDVDILAVDRILSTLEKLDPQQAQIIELRFFAGLTVEETAEALAVSPTTVKREWALARATLMVDLGKSSRRDGP